MKGILLLMGCVLTTALTNAQNTLPGYYITQNNDTVNTQIRLRKGVFGQTTNDFIKELEVIDSLTGPKVFSPDDIKGYGFTQDGLRVRFAAKPVKNGTKKFLSPVYVGAKSSLYQYGIRTSGGGGALASQSTFYTFEKSDGSYLFLRDILNKKFRTELKEFYKDNAEVQALIDTKLQYWHDLKKDLLQIMIVANR